MMESLPDKESVELDCPITDSPNPSSTSQSASNLKTSLSNKYTFTDLYKQAVYDATTIKLLFYGYLRENLSNNNDHQQFPTDIITLCHLFIGGCPNWIHPEHIQLFTASLSGELVAVTLVTR